MIVPVFINMGGKGNPPDIDPDDVPKILLFIAVVCIIGGIGFYFFHPIRVCLTLVWWGLIYMCVDMTILHYKWYKRVEWLPLVLSLLFIGCSVCSFIFTAPKKEIKKQYTYERRHN